MAKYEHAIINTSRWETETIIEWVKYYQEPGFDRIYIYCNDDDPLEMYTRLSPFIEKEDPYITFHFMPYQDQQPACWLHFLANYLSECDWFKFVDADEFLAIKPENSIKMFMRKLGQSFDCIHFNWIWFGPENFDERPRGSTLLQFTRREDELTSMNFFTKTINRSSCIDPSLIGRPPLDMMNHKWPATISARMREANVLGECMTEFFQAFPGSAVEFMSNHQRRSRILNTACI